MSFIQTSTTTSSFPTFQNDNTMNKISRLQKIFAKRIRANGLLPFLNLEKIHPCSDYKVKTLDNLDEDSAKSPNKSYHKEPKINTPRQKSILLPYAATQLRVSPTSPLSDFVSTSPDLNTGNLLNAFGILKPVPNPPPPSRGTFFEKRMILFNPPPPKAIVLDQQYHINKRKLGGKMMKNKFTTVVPTPFVFGSFNDTNKIK
ncbi:2850_t:CDS:2 [Funneliformis geosporum]|uniref:6526_t:CDS:1 n=1 Tax=Funneliformis geosporum TaxID=1117311 RepID=A0A9W4SB46_9GLOM|nr:2850_t:CDS:2 [Funneliformis geosporum]CAI2162868.1 6526_t:CDS:2 [Funneliformis geosporum]